MMCKHFYLQLARYPPSPVHMDGEQVLGLALEAGQLDTYISAEFQIPGDPMYATW